MKRVDALVMTASPSAMTSSVASAPSSLPGHLRCTLQCLHDPGSYEPEEGKISLEKFLIIFNDTV